MTEKHKLGSNNPKIDKPRRSIVLLEKRRWSHRVRGSGPQAFAADFVLREGWYLFGLLPLYVRDIDVRRMRA